MTQFFCHGRTSLKEGEERQRVGNAIDRGYIRNREDRKGRPAQLIPGDPLPDDVEVLPTVEKLSEESGCTVASVPEGGYEKS